MKKIKFYVCPNCENILTSSGKGEISCCGRMLMQLIPKPADEIHKLSVETIENDFYITFNHEMNKEHYISFIAYGSYDRLLLVKLYPEQGCEVRFPQLRGNVELLLLYYKTICL